MKKIVSKMVLFVFVVAGLSALPACEKSSTERPADENAAADAATGKTEPKKSDYPPAPEALLNADIKLIDGSTIKLADKKGKVVLINLWAVWCGPCREEMPELVALQDKYRGQGLEIVGLDTDEDETVERINEFAADMKLNYTLGWADKDKVFGEFIKITRVVAIPQSMLINREGRMAGVFAGANKDLIEKLKKAVAKAVAE